MPITKYITVDKLSLDLGNFRTVHQNDEAGAVKAMVSIAPEHFWALMLSLLDNGYLPIENVLVLKEDSPSKHIVKEGNRRVAALKVILGQISSPDVSLPPHISTKILALSSQWITDNSSVPCSIYDPSDIALVDKIVTLAHGYGEKASRLQWNAIARTRHARDFNYTISPALNLLEDYLLHGLNITPQQRSRWAGDYPITVLQEAVRVTHKRFGYSGATQLAQKYPEINYRSSLEDIILNIGLENIGFKDIRDKVKDFAAPYGLPATPTTSTPVDPNDKPGGTDTAASTDSQGAPGSAPNGTSGGAPAGSASPQSAGSAPVAMAINDPRGVTRVLNAFTPKGNNRQKVVTLLQEARQLKIPKTPLAFCFVLRSMFEISSKAYCDDHTSTSGPTYTKANGEDKSLVNVLREITIHLTNNNTDRAMVKALHGAMTELAKPDGVLSVTSMNQLVHNPSFSIGPGDISILFGNIFPLLEAMNS